MITKEIRLYASDLIYEEVNTLSYLIAVFTNPGLFPFDLDVQIPEAERLAIIETLKDRFAELFS